MGNDAPLESIKHGILWLEDHLAKNMTELHNTGKVALDTGHKLTLLAIKSAASPTPPSSPPDLQGS